jgi:hypothetical protein
MSEEQEEKIEKIGKITKSAKTPGLKGVDMAEQVVRMPPNKERFDRLVQTPSADQAAAQTASKSSSTSAPEKVEPISKTSLMDEVRNLSKNVDRYSKISPRELIAQADGVIHQIDEVKKKLATPNLEITSSTQSILQGKLAHIDENLRVALSKVGLEYNPSEQLENKKINPIERFLGFLTNGQSQLTSLSTELEQMHLTQKDLSPANMLRIQLKVGYITQEIEFFSAVLNKALDSTKTIMNVQV